MTLSLSKITRTFLTIGLAAPCALQTVFLLRIFQPEQIPEWLFLGLWPGFGFYMAADAGSSDFSGLLGFLMSVVANGIVYLLVGGLLSLCFRRLFQRRIPAKGQKD
jgi:hypothetical protein